MNRIIYTYGIYDGLKARRNKFTRRVSIILRKGLDSYYFPSSTDDDVWRLVKWSVRKDFKSTLPKTRLKTSQIKSQKLKPKQS